MAGHKPELLDPQRLCWRWCKAQAMAMVALMTKPIFVSCLYLPRKLSSPVHSFLLLPPLMLLGEEMKGLLLLMALASEDGPRREVKVPLLLDSAGADKRQSNRCSQNSWNQGFLALVSASGFRAK